MKQCNPIKLYRDLYDLVDKLVPNYREKDQPADTFAGEIIRATECIHYAFYRHGYMIGKGDYNADYNCAYRYLCDVLGGKEEYYEVLTKMITVNQDNNLFGYYEMAVIYLCRAIIESINEHHEYMKIDNNSDFRVDYHSKCSD